MECYLCESVRFEIIHKGVRDNPNIDVIKCKECGLVSLNKLDHITNSFYQNSGMIFRKRQ